MPSNIKNDDRPKKNKKPKAVSFAPTDTYNTSAATMNVTLSNSVSSHPSVSTSSLSLSDSSLYSSPPRRRRRPHPQQQQTSTTTTTEEDYDSDDLYDSVASSSGALPIPVLDSTSTGITLSATGDDQDTLLHDTQLQNKQVQLAKRKRQRQRLRQYNHEEDDDDDDDGADEILLNDDDDEEQEEEVDNDKRGRKVNRFNSNDGIGADGGEHYFQGEEEVDKRISLLTDEHDAAAAATASSQFDNAHEDNDDDDEIDTYIKGPNSNCPIEPFNLNEEREGGDGYFDGDTYIFRRVARRDEEPDAWVDSLSKESGTTTTATTGAAATASSTSTIAGMGRVASKQSTSKGNTGDHEKEVPSKEEIYKRITTLLSNPNETVLQALRRYGNVLKQQHHQQQQRKKKKRKQPFTQEGKENQPSQEEKEQEDSTVKKQAQESFTQLTELADLLLMNGLDSEIYDRTKGELLPLCGDDYYHERDHTLSAFADADDDDNMETTRMIPSKETMDDPLTKKRKRGSYFDNVDDDDNVTTGAGIATTSTEVHGTSSSNNQETISPTSLTAKDTRILQWEYRGNQDHAIHGPYTTQQMLEWINAGYFVGEQAVDVRMVRPPTTTTTPSTAAATKRSGDEEKPKARTDVDELMADLMDSDNDDENDEKGGDDHDGAVGREKNNDENGDKKTKWEAEAAIPSNDVGTEGGEVGNANFRGEWIRSDQVNFLMYS